MAEDDEEDLQGFNTVEELANAVMEGETGPLDVTENIGRIYSVEQIKIIADEAGTEAAAAVRAIRGFRGQNSCYERAGALVGACDDAEKLGHAVLRADRDQVFTLMSYMALPTKCASMTADDFWRALHERKAWTNTAKHYHQFSPYGSPGSWLPRLESLSVRENRVTFCFGQLRVLSKMRAHSYSVDDLAVVRVPTVVTLLFDLGIMEVALSPFAEAPMPYHGEAFPKAFPHRAFKAVEMCLTALQREEYIPGPPVKIPRNNLMIYLETKLHGEDLGWDIERMSGEHGEFDTTQSRRVPLKKILTDFTVELADKCEQGGYVDPLKGQDLYKLFRVLKSESHTLSMDLGVDIGKKGGRVELTAFYGKDEDTFPPLYYAMTKFTKASRDALREAASESMKAGKNLKDPFDITTTLDKKSIC